mgnify:CR=1 FL=1
MKILAKYKVKGYKDTSIWMPEFQYLNTESARRYSGRRMFRLINKSKIRATMHKAKW